MTYDAAGNTTSVTAANGHALTWSDETWAQDTRERLGYPRTAADLSDEQKEGLKALHTEHFVYDAENRVIKRWGGTSLSNRKDSLRRMLDGRFGSEQGGWETTYDAYGNISSERDPNGRVTTYAVGAYGQVLSKTLALEQRILVRVAPSSRYDELLAEAREAEAQAEQAIQEDDERAALRRAQNLRAQAERYSGASYTAFSAAEGQTVFTETNTYDWLGRLSRVEDSDGRDDRYGYDDADRLVRLTRRVNEKDATALDQVADYAYDRRGNRIQESLRREGMVLREQTNLYDTRGYLVGVRTHAQEQDIAIDYRYDQVGNRVGVNSHLYRYDADNRMVSVYESEENVTIASLSYDGFGNRASETRSQKSDAGGYEYLDHEYEYDLNGRITASWNTTAKKVREESWSYDAAGNTLHHGWGDGLYTENVYDESNRVIFSTATSDTGEVSETRTVYDAAGNAVAVRVQSDDYGFDECTTYDVRYHSQSKSIEKSWVNKAKYLYGTTAYTYDVNGQILSLDRGQAQGATERTVGLYAYDNEGKIIAVHERASDEARIGDLYAYSADPSTPGQEYARSEQEELSYDLFGGTGRDGGEREYFYVNGQQVGEVRTQGSMTLKTLTRTDSTLLVLEAEDVVRDAQGEVDRVETAARLAGELYEGYGQLSAMARRKVVERVAERLPAELAAGVEVQTLYFDAYLLVVDVTEEGERGLVVGDYAYETIGGREGLGGGMAVRHTVSSGETLQAIAAAYYGAPGYWYLIAEANGLSGEGELVAGTTLIIPSTIANSLNDKDTYKVYSESEIIGADSPEVRVKKRRSFFKALMMVLIVAITVYMAIQTGGWAAGVLGGEQATLVAYATVAAGSYAAMWTTSYVTQTLAIAADLQEDYDWKAMRRAGEGAAVSAVFAGFTEWALSAAPTADVRVATRVGLEAGRQVLEDGKITNVTGLMLAGWVDTLGVSDTTMRAGAELLDKHHHGQALNSMDWTNFAAGVFTPRSYQTETGDYDWWAVARQTALVGAQTATAGERLGEEAALQALGQGVANTVGGVVRGHRQWENAQFEVQDLMNEGLITPDEANRLLGDRAKLEAFGGLVQRGGQRAELAAGARQIAGVPSGLSGESQGLTRQADGRFEREANAQFDLEEMGLDPNAKAALLGDPELYGEYLSLAAASGDNAMMLAMGTQQLVGAGRGGARGAMYAANDLSFMPGGTMRDAGVNGGPESANLAGFEAKGGEAAAGMCGPDEYIIQPGDTFWGIAEEELRAAGLNPTEEQILAESHRLEAANPQMAATNLPVGGAIRLAGDIVTTEISDIGDHTSLTGTGTGVSIFTPEDMRTLGSSIKFILDSYYPSDPGNITAHLDTDARNALMYELYDQLPDESVQRLIDLSDAANLDWALDLPKIYETYLEPGRPLMVVKQGTESSQLDSMLSSNAAYRYGVTSGSLDAMKTDVARYGRHSGLVFDYSGFRNEEVKEAFAIFQVENYSDYDELSLYGISDSLSQRYADYQDGNTPWRRIPVGDGYQVYPSLNNLPPDLQQSVSTTVMPAGGAFLVDLATSLLSWFNLGKSRSYGDAVETIASDRLQNAGQNFVIDQFNREAPALYWQFEPRPVSQMKVIPQ